MSLFRILYFEKMPLFLKEVSKYTLNFSEIVMENLQTWTVDTDK